MKTGLLLLITLCSLISGCGGATGGTDSGNPDKISMQMLIYQASDFFNHSLAQLELSNITFNKALFALDKIHFRSSGKCKQPGTSSDTEIIEGPILIDLLSNQAIMELSELEIPDGFYCRITLRFKKIAGNISSDTIPIGNSILIGGERSDGIAFEFAVTSTQGLKLENDKTGIAINKATQQNRFLIGFDIEQWFQNIDLFDNNLEIGINSQGEPTIFINESINPSLYEQIILNIKKSAALFSDNDNDFNLDQTEQQQPLAEGDSVVIPAGDGS